MSASDYLDTSATAASILDYFSCRLSCVSSSNLFKCNNRSFKHLVSLLQQEQSVYGSGLHACMYVKRKRKQFEKLFGASGVTVTGN